jgi:hypothetical protein
VEFKKHDPAENEKQRNNVPEQDTKPPSWFYQNQQQRDKK